MFRDWAVEGKQLGFGGWKQLWDLVLDSRKCVSVSAGLKDMMGWILVVREETNPPNALQGAIGHCELNFLFLNSVDTFEGFFCLFAFYFYDMSGFKA